MPAAAPFTSETARQAGLRSAQVKAERRALRQPQLTIVAPSRVESVVETQLTMVEEQIERTRIELNQDKPFCPACERGPMEPHHRAQLLKALDTLLDRQRKLMQIPDPAQAKPQSTSRPRPAQAEPIEPQ